MFCHDTKSARRIIALALPILLSIAAVAVTAWAAAAGGGPAESATGKTSQPLAARVQSCDKVAEEKSPWGTLRWLVSAKLEPQSGITFGVVEINAGQSNPLHVHGNCDEVIYVVSGVCEQRVGKEMVVLKAGDTLRIPVGVPHTAKVIGSEPMRTIVAYNTGERQFTPVEEKADAK